jgi:GNAT superfamily N-acetyltransferase
LLASFDYGKFVPDAKVAVGDLCELSRVVVAEKFRGCGVSRLLVRACIAAALELKQRYILLECIPQHARMYEKYGFERAGENHQRAWGIDQLATVMRLALEDVPTNRAVQVAKRDIAMMRVPRPRAQPPGSLCLCRLSLCWERGEYDNRGLLDCPLKANFH